MEWDIFKIANKNALIFAGGITLFQMVLSSIFALFVSNEKTKGRNFLRVTYFIPVVLSVTVVCQLWLAIYNADHGLLNRLFEATGIDYKQNWLGDRSKAIYAIAFVNAWQWMGYQFALLLAGIKSTYNTCLVISLTGGIKAFTEMFIMTKGGPGTATHTLTYMMYKAAFREYRYGYGMAALSPYTPHSLALILFL